MGPKESIPNNAKQNRLEPSFYCCSPGVLSIKESFLLKEALALVDVRVLDHVIVGEGEGASLAERGLL
jgi:hypothetical protein